MSAAPAKRGPGRPAGKVGKAKKTLQIMARGHAEKALKTLVDICGDDEAPHAARVSAANAILDRAYGKPTVQVDMGGEVNVKGLADFYSEQAPQMLAALEGQVIDAAFTAVDDEEAEE